MIRKEPEFRDPSFGELGGWGATAWLAGLTIVLQAVSFRVAAPIAVIDGAQALRVAHVVVSALVLVAAFLGRKSRRTDVATALFLIVIVPFFFTTWMNHLAFARLGAVGAPLSGPKLTFLVLAVLVPGPYWVNAALIVAFAFEAFLIWRLDDFSRIASSLPHEPAMTGLFAVGALALLGYRRKNEALAREIAAMRARAELARGLTRVFLSLRNLSNSPLQTLSVSLEMMRKRRPEDAASLGAMEAAVEKLARMSRVYARLETEVEWSEQPLMGEAEIGLWIQELEKGKSAERSKA